MKKRATLIAFLLLSITLLPVFAQRGGTMSTQVFLPIVFGPSLNLEVKDIIGTQAVQRDNNSVSLVAGREAVIRAFVQDESGNTANRTVKLTVTNANGVSTYTVIRPLPTTSTRANRSSTANFQVPGNRIIVGENRFDVVVETQEGVNGGSNSTFTESMIAKSVPDIDLKIVPIDYVHQGGTLFDNAGADNFTDFMYDVFPVKEIDVSIRAAYRFNGNLADDYGNGDDWDQLLSNVTALKAADGAPESQFYMASVTRRDGNSSWSPTYGTAGIGWIGRRVSLTTDFGAISFSGEVAAHELGHNFGRRHAPCGGPSGVDSNFPYSNGSIGTFGYDITSSLLRSPSAYNDLMSYCNSQWVSDYTYEGIMNDQISDGRDAAVQIDDVLLIRASLRDDGVVIRPIYKLNATVSQARSVGDYQVALLDVAGETIAVHSVDLLEAIEENTHIRSIISGVPLPSEAVASIAILENGSVIGTRDVSNDLREILTASVSVEDGTLDLTWNLTEVPMLLRHRADDGSYSTLTLDASGGRYMTSINGLSGGVIEVVSADSSQRIEVALP